MSIPPDLNPDDMQREAVNALHASDPALSAALASLATLDLVHHLIDNLTPADTPEWHQHQDPTSDQTHLCVCNADAFTPYPTRPELELTWWTCSDATCDAVWEFREDTGQPLLVRGGLTGNEPPWNVHDLVRHRQGLGAYHQPDSMAEYIAILQSRDIDNPGWWSATVLRVVNPPRHTSPALVGQGIRLREGSMYNRVARFP